jgi:hypothetical protein
LFKVVLIPNATSSNQGIVAHVIRLSGELVDAILEKAIQNLLMKARVPFHSDGDWWYTAFVVKEYELENFAADLRCEAYEVEWL